MDTSELSRIETRNSIVSDMDRDSQGVDSPRLPVAQGDCSVPVVEQRRAPAETLHPFPAQWSEVAKGHVIFHDIHRPGGCQDEKQSSAEKRFTFLHWKFPAKQRATVQKARPARKSLPQHLPSVNVSPASGRRARRRCRTKADEPQDSSADATAVNAANQAHDRIPAEGNRTLPLLVPRHPASFPDSNATSISVSNPTSAAANRLGRRTVNTTATDTVPSELQSLLDADNAERVGELLGREPALLHRVLQESIRQARHNILSLLVQGNPRLGMQDIAWQEAKTISPPVPVTRDLLVSLNAARLNGHLSRPGNNVLERWLALQMDEEGLLREGLFAEFAAPVAACIAQLAAHLFSADDDRQNPARHILAPAACHLRLAHEAGSQGLHFQNRIREQPGALLFTLFAAGLRLPGNSRLVDLKTAQARALALNWEKCLAASVANLPGYLIDLLASAMVGNTSPVSVDHRLWSRLVAERGFDGDTAARLVAAMQQATVAAYAPMLAASTMGLRMRAVLSWNVESRVGARAGRGDQQGELALALVRACHSADHFAGWTALYHHPVRWLAQFDHAVDFDTMALPARLADALVTSTGMPGLLAVALSDAWNVGMAGLMVGNYGETVAGKEALQRVFTPVQWRTLSTLVANHLRNPVQGIAGLAEKWPMLAEIMRDMHRRLVQSLDRHGLHPQFPVEAVLVQQDNEVTQQAGPAVAQEATASRTSLRPRPRKRRRL